MKNRPWSVQERQKKKIQFEIQQKRRHHTNEWQRPTLWMEGTLSSLINNSILSYIGDPPSHLPPPAAQDLPIETDPPTLDSFSNSPNGEQQGWRTRQHITAEALQNGGDVMKDMVHDFCTKVFRNLILPNQRTTSIIVPLPNAAVNGQLELTLLKGRQRFDAISTSNLKLYKFREWWIFT